MARFITEKTLVRWYLTGWQDAVKGGEMTNYIPDGLIGSAYRFGISEATKFGGVREELDMTDKGIVSRLKTAK